MVYGKDLSRKDLEMISGKDIDWPELISSGEWLGRAIEEEIDRVREDRMRERRNRDRRRTLLTDWSLLAASRPKTIFG